MTQKSKTPSKVQRARNSSRTREEKIQFRERRFCDIDFSGIKHPRPNKDYKATLPGPPGWQYKIDPGK